MTRLSREDWTELDRLIGLHGFGGYYDLVECLKQIAGDLGISLTGLDLYPETDGGAAISLPQIVQYLQDWTLLLKDQEIFSELVERAAAEAEVKKA
jgi:hypothetical protein